jgi:hypothetical protein
VLILSGIHQSLGNEYPQHFLVSHFTMNINKANEKIQQLPIGFSPYKILNAMLNCSHGLSYEPFLQTQQIVAQDILEANDLEELAYQYDDCFLMPMRTAGGRPLPSEIATEPSSCNGLQTKVRKRYNHFDKGWKQMRVDGKPCRDFLWG